MEQICWSTSKADCVSTCLYKYNKVYNMKIKESSDALTLGSTAHEIIAEEIVNKQSSVEDLIARIDASEHTDPELYAMLPNISGFVEKWYAMAEPKGLEATIEKQYAVDRNFKKVDFFSPDAYIRGVFDMWAFDEAERKLIIIDHKSNKQAMSPAQVKDHTQLKLYVLMLTRMFNLDWDRAHVALNFLRHNKLVWASFSQEENNAFEKKYLKYLQILEDAIIEAYETNNWKTQPGHYCRWCSFKNECGG